MIHSNTQQMMSSSHSAINPLKIAICGYTGRIGQQLSSLIRSNPKLQIVAAFCHPSDLQQKSTEEASTKLSVQIQTLDSYINALSSKNNNSAVAPDAPAEPSAGPSAPAECSSKPLIDVIIDFSSPDGTMKCLDLALHLNIPVVIGTTGLSEEQEQRISIAAKSIPVMYSANYSLGVNLLVYLTKIAASVLKASEFNAEIIEAHHNRKVDSPSGTALALAAAVCDASERSVKTDCVFGRQGRVGQRSEREVGVHAVRMGNVVGDHTVYFGSDFERIELTHRAETREVFAAGALKAAEWIVGRMAGVVYTVNSMLSVSQQEHQQLNMLN